MELTVGRVSGIISAAVFLGRSLFCPSLITVSFTSALALVVIMVGLMQSTNSAITWSVFSRLIHKSPWSFILNTDSNATTKVKRLRRVLARFS